MRIDTLNSPFRARIIKLILITFLFQILGSFNLYFVTSTSAAGLPASINATRNSATGLVSISWTAPSDTTNLTGYKVYVDSAGNGKYVYQILSSSTLSTAICFPYTGTTLVSVASITSGSAPSYTDNNQSSANNTNWTIQDMGSFGSPSGTSCATLANNAPTYDYSIAYNANGGSGSMASVSGNDWTVTLAPNAYTRSNWAFYRWNTAANASGTSYIDTQTVTLSSNLSVTLYAQWSATITYDGNGFTGGSAPASVTKYSSAPNLTVSSNSGNLVNAGFTFAGWNTAADGLGTTYAVGSTYTVTGNATLYAKWQAAASSYTVTYDPNSGTLASGNLTDTATVTAGGNALGVGSKPSTDPTRSGYSFIGWNTDSAATTALGSPVSTDSDLTLYAVWQANKYQYNANTGTGGPTDQSYEGSTLQAITNAFTAPAGYTFDGWCTVQLSPGTIDCSTSGTKYAESANLPTPSSSTIVLYAIWKTTPSSGGGGSPAPVYVPHPPTITSISAAEVCAITPQLVIKGTWLTGATAKVDGVAAQVLATSQTEMTVVLPSAPVGTKTITVTNADGSATTTVKYAFADTPIYVNFVYPETYKDRAFSYVFKAIDAAKYEISGVMPAGLTLNSTTGELSGAPTQEGNFVFQIIASNICASTPLIVYMFVDKAIPTAFTCSVAFNVPSSNNISEIKLANLKNCLSKTSTLSPKYINPVIFISGGLPAGLTSDQALTHPRYLPILDLIVSMNLNAQIYYGAFNGSTDSVQLNVYWPDPS